VTARPGDATATRDASPATQPAAAGRPGRGSDASLAKALARYRVLAYVVGVGLVVLVCVGVPLKYLAGIPAVVEVVGPLHGFLYLVYLLSVGDLSIRARWSPVRTILVMLAGTVPFLSFVAERATTRHVQARLVGGEPPA
jgi:integral membrane protein